MEIEDFLLLLLDELNGTIESETRIQKLAFLTEREIDLNLGIGFKWHHYGPYSKDVTNRLQGLKKEEMMTIKKERRVTFMGDSYTIKTFSLTPEGRVKAKKIRERVSNRILENIRSLIKQYGLKRLSDLLNYIYMSYSPKDL